MKAQLTLVTAEKSAVPLHLISLRENLPLLIRLFRLPFDFGYWSLWYLMVPPRHGGNRAVHFQTRHVPRQIQTTPLRRCAGKLVGDSKPGITSGSKTGGDSEISAILSARLSY